MCEDGKIRDMPACRVEGTIEQYAVSDVKGDTKKRELLKTPTKIEEIQERKIIDRN